MRLLVSMVLCAACALALFCGPDEPAAADEAVRRHGIVPEPRDDLGDAQRPCVRRTTMPAAGGSVGPRSRTGARDVALRGSLILPHAWRTGRSVSIMIAPSGLTTNVTVRRFDLEVADMVQLGGDRYGFSLEGLVAGTYQVVVEPLEIRRLVRTAPGMQPIEIRAAPPGDVRVRIVDARTGRAIRSANLTWNGAIPAGVGGWSAEPAEQSPEPGEFIVRAPLGAEIELSTHPDGYRWTEQTTVVRPLAPPVVMRLHRACGVRLRLVSDEGEVDWNDDPEEEDEWVAQAEDPDAAWKVELQQLGGRGKIETWSSDGRLTVSDCGRYRLRIHSAEGWAPVPDRDVTVPAAGFVDVSVPVRAKGRD